MNKETPNPIRAPLSPEERQQIKTLLTFLGFIVTVIFIVGMIISVVSNSWWGG